MTINILKTTAADIITRVGSLKTQTYKFLGVRLNPLTIGQLHTLIDSAIQRRECRIIANHNLHSIYLFHHDARMRHFYAKADYAHIDSMILVLLGKSLGLPFQRHHRVTYADWTPELMAEAEWRQWRIFYLGSKPGIAERGAAKLRSQYPGLQIETAHGYFDPRPGSRENQGVLSKIAAYEPHVLMVGMSMPRQEHWILDNLEHIQANVILPAGAAIDYVAGAVPTPPRWAGRVGLEWLFRLVAEPGRLWQRYLLEPLFLIKYFVLSKISTQRKRSGVLRRGSASR